MSKHLDCSYESDSRYKPGELVYCTNHRECLEQAYYDAQTWYGEPRRGRHEWRLRLRRRGRHD